MVHYENLKPDIYYEVKQAGKSLLFYARGETDRLIGTELSIVIFEHPIGICKFEPGDFLFRLPLNAFPLDVIKNQLYLQGENGTKIVWFGHEHLANYPLLKSGLQGMYLTKKGEIREHGFLESRFEQFYEVHEKVSSVLLQEFGYELLVSHGTLLGLYRDGQLIEHDDDYDTCYVSRETDILKVRSERFDILRALQANGLKSSCSPLSGNMRARLTKAEIDIMPAWYENGNFAISNFTYFEDTDFDSSAQESEFYGQNLKFFKDAEKFLRLQYGESWRTPDPSFRYVFSNRCAEIKKILSATDVEILRFGRLGALKKLATKLAGPADVVPETKMKLRRFVERKMAEKNLL